ncbi:MAG: hypothetical protein D6763_08075 [Alphaproteobacteria bacterium]|nr:MAG: hypothetical protein D6763_08075 [Alphaproteobacteria bacterium]
MNRLLTTLVLLLVVVAGLGLYQLKYQTQRLQQEVAALDHQLASDRAAIRVLEAEWTYLTRPERLAALSQRYLALAPTSGEQIAPSPEVIARRDDPTAVLAQVDDFRAPSVVLAKAPPVPRDHTPSAPTEARPAAPVLEVRRDRDTPLFERIKLVLMEGGYE